MSGPVIELRGLRHRYASREVLHGIDLSIEAGEIFGFLGHNGAGKTTAINILTTLMPPTSGAALVCGHDVVAERAEVTRCIGYVPAEVRLYGHMSAAENLTFFARLGAALVRERAFSADVAHQLRTPLASLRLRLETEQDGGDPGGTLVDDAIRDVERLDQTITDLLALAQDRIETHETHPLATSVRETVSRWEQKLGSDRRLVVECEPQLPWVQASPAAIRQILDVLIDNALTHASGEVRLSAFRVGTGSVVAVADDGTTVVDPDRIFERRHTESTGSGIGLALARRLAEAEDLRLVVAQPGPGVVFHLIFGGPPVPPRSGRVERDD